MVVLAGVGASTSCWRPSSSAITQVLVYIGAIVVLFLFGIMLTRAPIGRSDDLDNASSVVIGVVIGLVLLGVLGYALDRRLRTDDKLPRRAGVPHDNTEQVVRLDLLAPTSSRSRSSRCSCSPRSIGAIVLARRD